MHHHSGPIQKVSRSFARPTLKDRLETYIGLLTGARQLRVTPPSHCPSVQVSFLYGRLAALIVLRM